MLTPFDLSTHPEIAMFCDRLQTIYYQRDHIAAHQHPSGYVLIEYISRYADSYSTICSEIIDPRTTELNICEGFLIDISHEETIPEQLQNFEKLARQEISTFVDEWINNHPFTK